MNALIDHTLTGVVILVWDTNIFSPEFLVHLRRSVDLLIGEHWVHTTIECLPDIGARAVNLSSCWSCLEIIWHKYSVRINVIDMFSPNHLLGGLACREILDWKNFMTLKGIGVVWCSSLGLIDPVIGQKTLYEALLIEVHHGHVLVTHSQHVQGVFWFL
jgi:hypothetical protein